MKNEKNILSIIAAVIFSIIFSSCDGVLFDDITYVDYPVYTVHPVSHMPMPFRQGHARRFEPVQRMPHNNIQPKIQRNGPRGVVQSGRGFNRH